MREFHCIYTAKVIPYDIRQNSGGKSALNSILLEDGDDMSQMDSTTSISFSKA
jgi:hypothetical protein